MLEWGVIQALILVGVFIILADLVRRKKS